MDPFMIFFSSLYIPLFHEFSLLLHSTAGLLIITSILMFIVTIKFKQKRTVLPIILISLLLSVVFAQGAKEIYHEDRTCLSDKVACPTSPSFPSSHATVGFALLLPSIGTPAFWIYLLYAILIALSRLYLGVHSLFDIAGSLGVALIGYTIAKFIVIKLRLVAHEIRV
ncbi:phosphatase PAP2 family protein [Candidatus Micrarchaeota archaeon]|nr:phosphatase PAP2 family protein [Candidatus Micrarchaeota archaeon]